VRSRGPDSLIVQPDEGGRLDQFLVRRVPGCSRRTARAAIAAGAVRVNGLLGRKGDTVRAPDVVALDRSIFERELIPQPQLDLTVLYADEALVAVDKPAGMPAVALRADDRGTVANYLVGRYPELREVGGTRFEAGLVHRLDTPTSGALLAARSAAAWQALRAEFRARRVHKLYLAVVAGELTTSGTIDAPIAHRSRHSRRMCVCTDPARAAALCARPARTSYRPLRRIGGTTLLAVRISTGVRHQIRVHLASIGHPIIGDATYGEASTTHAAPRLLLHASRICIAHPVGGWRLRIRCPLPEEFQAACRDLPAPHR